MLNEADVSSYLFLRLASDTKVYFRNVPYFRTMAQNQLCECSFDTIQWRQNTQHITHMVFHNTCMFKVLLLNENCYIVNSFLGYVISSSALLVVM
jgi:hypothetical protein